MRDTAGIVAAAPRPGAEIVGGEVSRRSLGSFDHLVGAGEQGGRDVEPSALAVLRLIASSYFGGPAPAVRPVSRP